MHHLYPSSKGDQLCPLGFHPQVRWPTRCKRCFRDYKEHGGKRGGDDLATSSPNLTDSSNAKPSRSWTSSQNLSSTNGNGNDVELRKRPQSWTSTPDLDEADGKSLLIKPVENNVDVSLSVKIPQRRHTTTLDSKELEDTFTMRQPSTSSQDIPNDLVIQYTDNLAERVRKMNLLKKQKSEGSREASRERSLPRKDESNVQTNTAPPDRPERKQSSNSNSSDSSSRRSITPTKKVSTSSSASSSGTKASSSTDTSSNNSVSSLSSKSSHKSQTKKDSDKKKASDDVEFMLKIKDNQKRASGKFNDNTSMTTETTGTTIIAAPEHELKEEINALRSELDVMRSRAERAERDKSDILLRRLAAIDTGPNRTAASEALSLQQKVNELKSQLEKVNDEKRNLNARLKELESGPKSAEYDLRRKLQAAEQLCEELMEENTAVKREVRGLEAEMEEMHDSFRDTQAEVNTSLQKQLESTTKNCRILSFKLKKSERKIEILEQEKEAQGNVDTVAKIKKLEEELRFANELARTLQAEAENLKHPNKKKPPMLGVIGKSTSADGKITRESLTRGGSQEDPQQLLRDLQDSIERESDLKEQLKFSEQEAENLRKKLVRFEDENESMMMQLKKMASRSRSRKLSPTPNRLTPERATGERDEGISDEDDATELKILLDLNEQEAAILRLKVEDLEKQNTDVRTQLKELQEKFKNTEGSRKFSGFFGTNTQSDKTVKTLNEELNTLRKSLIEKDTVIQRLQAEVSAAKTKNSSSSDLNVRKQLDSVEQEATILRSKITSLETENEKLLKENKRMQLQSLRKPSINDSEKSSGEVVKLKESLGAVEKERDELQAKIKRILQETEEKLPNRTPHNITDLTPKNTLKRWVGDLEDEIKEMRAIILNSGADKTSKLETENASLKKDLENAQEKLKAAESDLKKLKVTSSSSVKASDLKKAEDETKKLNSKIRELEDKIKKQDVQIKEVESAKTAIESQAKKDKEKLSNLEKDYEKERKDKDKLEGKVAQIETEFTAAKKSADKLKATLEKEIKELKSKSANSRVDASSSRQVQDLKKQLEDLQTELKNEQKKYSDLNAHWENLSEETVLMRAQLTTEKDNLKAELTTLTQKLLLFDQMKTEKFDISKKLKEAQKKIQDLESKQLKVGAAEYEKTLLKNTIAEKEQEFDRLRRENEMNIDLIFQLRKDNDDLNQKLNDFNRVEQAQLSLNGHNATLQNEIKSLRIKLENSELSAKSEVASTRLRYEQQVKTLSAEMSSMQRQCERFKKDRDTFKQLLESAQKKIGDLKANTGRQSRGSMHSSDDDDKSKIAYLEQQIGCLEDQLCEARLDVSKYKTELVSERSANEIKIAEMQSKLNEFEEDRVIGSGRTKIPGMKTKLELSWQKEREDQQRLLQETSTLARDLRQTLFEVERERDKERLESKRRTDQLKRNTEEELEEGRKKIAELQCDLLELRDVHAKLRTSNEKLRRERERYEKELIKRRMEQDGGERKVGALLQTVDELVKIAPDLKRAGSLRETIPSTSSRQTLQPESASRQRSRSPSPSASASQITSVLARLAEASEELRKFQRMAEEENERIRLKRGNFRRAASQETDAAGNGPVISSRLVNSRLSRSNNGSLYRKSLSLDQSIQQDQAIWRQDDGSVSSVQSIDSEFGGLIRDSSMDSRLDSRLSGGSTQSDAPRGPRKKKRTLMGKLRSLTKSSRNSESELSVQGSDSDISVASDARTSRKDLRGRLSGMFRRSGSTSRSESMELGVSTSQPRPVAVTVVGDGSGPGPHNPPPSNTKPTRTIQKPPTPTTPITKRRIVKKD